jgi:hypothetical protein
MIWFGKRQPQPQPQSIAEPIDWRVAAQLQVHAMLIQILVNMLKPDQLERLRGVIRYGMANPSVMTIPAYVPDASKKEFSDMVIGLLQSMVLADSKDERDKDIAEQWKSFGGTTTDNP